MVFFNRLPSLLLFCCFLQLYFASYESFETSRDDDVNTNAADEVDSDKVDAASKRRVEPTFRLGRRHSSQKSADPAGDELSSRSPTFRLGRRGGANRRSTTFRLGRPSAYDSFTTNYDAARLDQVDTAAENRPQAPADGGSTFDDDVGRQWWPVTNDRILLRQNDVDDSHVSASSPSIRAGKRGDSEPTFRLGRADPTFRLGRRSSASPTFRLGKRDPVTFRLGKKRGENKM